LSGALDDTKRGAERLLSRTAAGSSCRGALDDTKRGAERGAFVSNDRPGNDPTNTGQLQINVAGPDGDEGGFPDLHARAFRIDVVAR
jgi:hypothetical protein